MNPPTLPYDLQAERAALGAILLDRDAVTQVAGWLQPEHFYLEKHDLIYRAALACYSRREPPDLATVAAELRRQDQLELVGGASFLGELAAEVPTAVHIEYYGRTVEETAAGRQLIQTGGKIAALGYDTTRPIGERIAGAEELVFNVGRRRKTGRDFVSFSQVANETLEWLTGDDSPGLLTGFYDLDDKLQGLQPGDLVIIGARPSMGKTAMALALVDHICITLGQPAQIFSLEMNRRSLMVRLAAMRARIDVQRVRPGRLAADEMERFIDALSRLALDDLLVDDTPCEHIDAMRAKARRSAATVAPAMVVVDYLGLAEADGENRVQEVSKITRNLKAMARELECPVIALSQLSRAVEGRAVKVPTLADLRDSGSVEQDADIVMFLHRPEYYDKRERPGIAEVHIAKQRNGPLGTVELVFDGPRTQFLNPAPAYRDIAEYQPRAAD
jgi:replicative DNA helicase